MSSYVVIYGQPKVNRDSAAAQAVVLLQDHRHTTISPDRRWHTRIRDILDHPRRERDSSEAETADWIGRNLPYFRIGRLTQLDIDEGTEDVLERLYFS